MLSIIHKIEHKIVSGSEQSALTLLVEKNVPESNVPGENKWIKKYIFSHIET